MIGTDDSYQHILVSTLNAEESNTPIKGSRLSQEITREMPVLPFINFDQDRKAVYESSIAKNDGLDFTDIQAFKLYNT